MSDVILEVAAFTAFLLGGVWAMTLMALTSGGGQRKVLFAPFLAAGGLIACCLALIS